MLLTLIADIADDRGAAGPFVRAGAQLVTLRDWLGEALAQMSGRDPRRESLIRRVESDLRADGSLPAEPQAAQRRIEEEAHERILATSKTNVSRAVSELVKAGLLSRHYQGYRVDHCNRGARRHAVYTLAGAARQLVRRNTKPAEPRQRDLFA